MRLFESQDPGVYGGQLDRMRIEYLSLGLFSGLPKFLRGL